MANARHFFTPLEALRGIAAIMVMLRHTEGVFGPVGSSASYLGVDLFFLLSGVVLANSYEGRLRSHDMSPAGFLLQRCVRLYPLYILSLPVGVTSYLVAGGSMDMKLLSILAKALFFIPSVSHIPLFPLNHPAWSLFFELCVGILFSVLLFRVPSMLLLVIAWVSAAITVPAAMHSGNIDIGFQPAYFAFGFFRVMFSFALGIWLYRLHDRKIPTRTKHANVIGVSLCIVVAAILAMPGEPSRLALYRDFAVCLLIFPAIVWLAMRVEPHGVTANVFRWLGRLSYPLYILHAPLFHLLGALKGKAVDFSTVPSSTIMAIAVLSGLSALATAFYDEPLRRKLKRMLERNRNVSPLASSARQ